MCRPVFLLVAPAMESIIYFLPGGAATWAGTAVGAAGGAPGDVSLKDRQAPHTRPRLQCDFDLPPHFTLSCQTGFRSDDISFSPTPTPKKWNGFRNETAASPLAGRRL